MSNTHLPPVVLSTLPCNVPAHRFLLPHLTPAAQAREGRPGAARSGAEGGEKTAENEEEG